MHLFFGWLTRWIFYPLSTPPFVPMSGPPATLYILRHDLTSLRLYMNTYKSEMPIRKWKLELAWQAMLLPLSGSLLYILMLPFFKQWIQVNQSEQGHFQALIKLHSNYHMWLSFLHCYSAKSLKWNVLYYFLFTPVFSACHAGNSGLKGIRGRVKGCKYCGTNHKKQILY